MVEEDHWGLQNPTGFVFGVGRIETRAGQPFVFIHLTIAFETTTSKWKMLVVQCKGKERKETYAIMYMFQRIE